MADFQTGVVRAIETRVGSTSVQSVRASETHTFGLNPPTFARVTIGWPRGKGEGRGVEGLEDVGETADEGRIGEDGEIKGNKGTGEESDERTGVP